MTWTTSARPSSAAASTRGRAGRIGRDRICCRTQSVLARFEDTGRLSREAALDARRSRPGRPSLAASPATFASTRARGCTASPRYPSPPTSRGTYWPGLRAPARDRHNPSPSSASSWRASPPGAAREPAAADACGPRARRAGGSPQRGLAGRGLPRRHNRREGRFSRYKIVDPTFHNWPALAYAMRDQEISDFPICNKSFNLSYCGHDL